MDEAYSMSELVTLASCAAVLATIVVVLIIVVFEDPGDRWH